VTTNDSASPYEADLMAAVTDLGTALRELIEASIITTVGASEVRAAAELVRAATPHVAASCRPVSQLPSLDDPASGRRIYNPVSGIGSPLAPPLAIRRITGGRPGEVAAEAILGAAYEGPPSYLHGGMSALFLDQMLGAAAGAAGLWGMTARLELDYRRPVPLETRLVLRAGVTENSGRKTVLTGTIATTAEPGTTLVEAHGIFVQPRPELAAAYFGSITDAAGRHTPPRRPSDATATEGD